MVVLHSLVLPLLGITNLLRNIKVLQRTKQVKSWRGKSDPFFLKDAVPVAPGPGSRRRQPRPQPRQLETVRAKGGFSHASLVRYPSLDFCPFAPVESLLVAKKGPRRVQTRVSAPREPFGPGLPLPGLGSVTRRFPSSSAT